MAQHAVIVIAKSIAPHARCFGAFALVLTLTACGQRGPLTMPIPPTAIPASGGALPASVAPAKLPDGNASLPAAPSSAPETPVPPANH